MHSNDTDLITAIKDVKECEFDDLDIQLNETDTENPELDYDPNELQSDVLQEIGEGPKENFERFKLLNKISDIEYYILIRILNEMLIIHVLSCFKLGDTPMDVFVARPAGYGKSVLIKALYRTLARVCETKGSNPDELIVLLVAPGGKTAHAIHGITAHATFSLPLSQSGNKMFELSVDVAKTISSYFLNVKAIIVIFINLK
jgi:hypothetical protein